MSNDTPGRADDSRPSDPAEPGWESVPEGDAAPEDAAAGERESGSPWLPWRPAGTPRHAQPRSGSPEPELEQPPRPSRSDLPESGPRRSGDDPAASGGPSPWPPGAAPPTISGDEGRVPPPTPPTPSAAEQQPPAPDDSSRAFGAPGGPGSPHESFAGPETDPIEGEPEQWDGGWPSLYANAAGEHDRQERFPPEPDVPANPGPGWGGGGGDGWQQPNAPRSSDAGQMFTMSALPKRSSAGRTIGLLVGGGVFALLLVAYIVLVLTVGNRIPSGTTVAGVDIGGLGPSQAAGTLERDLADRMDRPIRVRAAGESFRLNPEKVGLSLDADATAQQAYVPGTLNPITLIGAISGGEQQPVVTAEKKPLTAELEKIAKKANRQPREGEIRFDDGEALPVQPRDGAKLDLAGARSEIRGSYLTTDEPIALPTTKVSTVLEKSDVQKALADFAEPAMSGPVTLRFADADGADDEGNGEGEQDGDEENGENEGDQTVEADPTEFGQALVMQERGGELKPLLDPDKLLDALDDELTDVLTQPEDARIEIQDDSPEVIPAQAGLSPDKKELEQNVVRALAKQGDERVAEVSTTAKEPELGTEELEGLGVEEVIGEFSTDFPYANYRNVNIARAAELMDGSLVLPDETFSMNKTVGERTKDNGFTGGYVIKNGSLTVEQGGGVSQVATTMYNAAFFAGMKDVEHRPHGFYIDRYPVGREATLYWGSLDLKWQNTTPHAVHVEAWADQAEPGGTGSITVRLWSTPYYEVRDKTSDRYDKVPYKEIKDDSKEGCVDQEHGVDGFTVDVERWLYRDGEEVDHTKDSVQYDPQNVIKCKYPEQVD